MVSPEERIAGLERRLRSLEETNAFLWKEKSFAVEALEEAVTMGSFDTSLNRLDDPRPILEVTLARAKTLLPFRAAAVYLVREDSSFSQAICSPPELAAELDEIVSREGEWRHLSDYSLSLLSVLLSAAAGALESFELYRDLRRLNLDLAERMSQLEEYRKFLEQQVEQRTRELSRANEEMKMEIAERMRAEEDLRSSEEMLRLAVEGMGDGVWLWNRTTGKTDLSPLSAEILCGGAEDPAVCISKSVSADAWEEIIHEDDRERYFWRKERCFAGENSAYSVEYRVLGKDGQE
ncbi:MAG: hypothetical protein PWP47_699, partial [Synergistaceae bacterium]|nr:hypothetical protein [Synergistaceae bacterium]